MRPESQAAPCIYDSIRLDHQVPAMIWLTNRDNAALCVSIRPGRLSVAQKCASSTSCKDARASLMPKGAYISQVAQRIIDNLLPCIDDRSVEHRVLVQGRLGALHKADLEPIICSLMVAKVSESRTLEHRQSLWISRAKVPSDSSES